VSGKPAGKKDIVGVGRRHWVNIDMVYIITQSA